ncbi:unnamed protein product, partial [Musa banksii]
MLLRKYATQLRTRELHEFSSHQHEVERVLAVLLHHLSRSFRAVRRGKERRCEHGLGDIIVLRHEELRRPPQRLDDVVVEQRAGLERVLDGGAGSFALQSQQFGGGARDVGVGEVKGDEGEGGEVSGVAFGDGLERRDAEGGVERLIASLPHGLGHGGGEAREEEEGEKEEEEVGQIRWMQH